MDEQKTKEEIKSAETKVQSENSNVGIPAESESPIDAANRAAERLEIANREKARLLEKEERLIAERKLSGKTYAGQMTKEESEAEMKKRGAKEFWKGTDIESAIDKYG
jgi:hypothetical protein